MYVTLGWHYNTRGAGSGRRVAPLPTAATLRAMPSKTTSRPPDRRLTALYPRLLSGTLVLSTAAIALAWLALTPPGLLGKASAIGYAVCHRIAERSFHLHNQPLPLCARCTGIYLGVMIGLGVFAARGRLRATQLPPLRLLAAQLALAATIAVDGLNSYLSLFEFYTPLYPPHNTLRLFTGLAAGTAMITLALPVFSATVWRAPARHAPVASWRDLALLWGAAIAGGLAVLTQQPLVLWLAGFVSAAGVLLMFALVGAVVFTSVTRREGTAQTWRDLALPGVAGLGFALALIGGIDALRYALTGTWDGFNLPG